MKYISRQKLYFFLLAILFMNHFVYRGKIALIVFYGFSFCLIVITTYFNRRQGKEFAPSVALLVYVFVLFVFLYLAYLLLSSLAAIDPGDVRFLTLGIVIPLVFHYYKVGKKYALMYLSLFEDA